MWVRCRESLHPSSTFPTSQTPWVKMQNSVVLPPPPCNNAAIYFISTSITSPSDSRWYVVLVICVCYAVCNFVLTFWSAESIIVPRRIIWSWYINHWWVCCYIWYSEEGTRRGRSPPRPLLAVPNVTARRPVYQSPCCCISVRCSAVLMGMPIKGYPVCLLATLEENGHSYCHETFRQCLWDCVIKFAR